MRKYSMHDGENKEGGEGGGKGYIDKKIEPRRMKIKGYRITRGYWTEIEGVGPWEGRGLADVSRNVDWIIATVGSVFASPREVRWKRVVPFPLPLSGS